MKKHLSILFVILLLFALPSSAFAALSTDTDGSYRISTSADLVEFREMVNAGSGDLSAKLTEDIDLERKPWIPIGKNDGTNDYSYRGTFDGNGFTILNLTVTSADLVPVRVGSSECRSAGLFGVLSSDACIQNLSIEGISIDVPESQDKFQVYAGAVAGVVLSGDIQNCTVTGGTINGYFTGGVAGGNDGGDIQNCTVTGGTISGNRAGGVAGVNGGDIQNCTVTGGTIGSHGDAGGVAGYNSGDIQNCTVTGGTITGNGAGGVAGVNGGNIQTCTVTGGKITGALAGGVAGYMNKSSANVQNCAVFGVSISAAEDSGSGAYSGAIVGIAHYGTIQNCVAMDGEKTSVSASEDGIAHAGGALGWIDASKASITYTYYPAGIVDTDGIFSSLPDQGGKGAEWAIGNIKPGEMPGHGYTEVTSYDAKLSSDQLPSITAVIKQGIAVTIKKGVSYELDLTPLPGTKEEVSCTWTLNEGEGIVSIAAKDLIVSVTGLELGTATVQCVVRGLMGEDEDNLLTLTCRVTVVEADPDPTPTGGGSSSNCNSGVGAAFFALAGLFFVGKRKK